MFNNIRGIIVFQALAPQPEEFINRIKNSRIPCMNIQLKNGVITGRTYRKYYKDLTQIAESQNAELSIQKKKGFIFLSLRYKRRYGIFAGTLLAIGFVFYMSNIVLKIEIQGNSIISAEQILSCLRDSGIDYGSFIPGMDFQSAERSLMTSMKSAAWIGIRHIGGRVVVEVDELDSAPEIIPMHVPCNVIASRNAQILNAKVFRGVLIPQIGDGVKKGDLLISGVSAIATGEYSTVHAYGTVTGRYTDKAVFTQNFTEQQNLLSGEEIHRKMLRFFGLKIPLYIGKEINGEFEYEENTNYFSFFQVNLPLGISFETYRPFTVQEVIFSVPEAEAAVREKVAVYESNFVKPMQILSKEEQLTVNDNQLQLVVLYTMEGEIGISQEILIKKQN